MEMLRHHHIAPNHKIEFLPHFFQNFEKQVATACRAQELKPVTFLDFRRNLLRAAVP